MPHPPFLSLLLSVVIAYVIGSIPTGYLIARQLKGIDIREHGSGNVGATNVKRVVGPKAGYVTLALDWLKGFVTLWLALHFVPGFDEVTDPWRIGPILTTLAVILGHSRSMFINFTGGKSVITSVGTFFALFPLAGLCTVLVGVVLIKLTRYVSLGSIVGALFFPVWIWVFHEPLSYLVMACVVSGYVVYLHRSNIVRLMNGQENRL